MSLSKKISILIIPNSLDKLLVFLMFMLAYSCSSVDDVKDIALLSEDPSELLVLFPDSSVVEGRQLVDQQINTVDGRSLLRGFPRGKVLQKINLTTGKVTNIPIPKEGPNTINRLNGFTYFSSQKLLLFGNSKVLTIDEEGTVTSSVSFTPDFMENANLGDYYVRVNHQFPPSIWEDQVILHLEKATSGGMDFPEHYQGFAFASFDTRDFSLKPLDIGWDQLDEGYFGALQEVHFSVLDDNLVYGFAFSPYIYRFDLASGVKSTQELPPFLDFRNSNYLGGTSPQEELQHRSTSVRYKEIMRCGDFYFQQVFTPPIPADNRFGKGHLLGFRAFDLQFNLVAESIMPKGTMPEQLCENGDFYHKLLSENESEIRYAKTILE